MVEGGRSISCDHSGSSSSHSSSSSSSKGRDTRLLIRLSPLVQTDRIHSFFDRSLSLAKPPIGPGFVKKVHRKSDESVILSIEDSSIARRLVSSFSDSRPKIDGHEFSIELYSSEHSKSLPSPSNHNGDKRREKDSNRMTSCSSQPSPSSSSSKRPSSLSSPSTSSYPSTSNNDSNRKERYTSSSVDPYNGIVGVSMHSLPEICDRTLKEIISIGLREEVGAYRIHFNDVPGGTKVLLKRSNVMEEMQSRGELKIGGEAAATFISLPKEEVHKLYDRYSSSDKCVPSTSSSSSAPSLHGRHLDALDYYSSRTVFLPCLPKGDLDYRKRFSKFGILDFEMKNINTVSPHAIAQFSNTQGAILAMEEYEREQREEGEKNPIRKRKRPHFVATPPSTRVWVANLPSSDEDYLKKKLTVLVNGSGNPTIVVDQRRKEGIIDFSSLDKAKYYLQIIKSSPLIGQGGTVHTWLVADFCSDKLYDKFIERRGIYPSTAENDIIHAMENIQPNEKQRMEATARLERLRGGNDKKKSLNGENGHSHSPSSHRRLNGEDRRSGDSGFSEDRERATNQTLDSDDDEMLERKWRTVTRTEDRSEENGKMRKRMIGLDEKMANFINDMPKKDTRVKKEMKEDDDGEKKENEKFTREEKVNNFRNALLSVTTPLKARSLEEMVAYRGNPLKSPPIPISPLNRDKDNRHLHSSPPSGCRPAPLHINIPPSTSTLHSNSTHSPYYRIPPSSSTSSSRHPSISTPSNLTPRSQTLPSSSRHFPNEHNGDYQWNGGTPTTSRHPLSRRESVCSNSSQSYTPLPPSHSSTIGGTSNPLKSPPVNTWTSSANGWKGGAALPSPLPSSINRPRPSIDSHHKPSTPSLTRPMALPKHNSDKSSFGLGPSSSHPKIPSLPRSSSMSEKKGNVPRDSSKEIVNNILHNERELKKMPRIPKKENREKDEKDERREKKRDEKDRDDRKEKKEDRKKSRENETKDQKAERRKEKKEKKKEREKEERKKNMCDKEKKKKSFDGEKKKKKKQKRTSSDSESDSDEDDFKPSSSKQMESDEALARLLASGGSMYDRVKGRRSGPSKEEKKKNDALEAIRKKNEKKSKKRVHLSSSESEEEKEMKKSKKEEDGESSDQEGENERINKENKKENNEKRETSGESESGEDREKERRGEEKKRKKKEKKVSKSCRSFPSAVDLFSETDSEKSVKKDKLTKKRSHDREEKECSPSTSHLPPPEKKPKKEETSSSESESEDEIERSSKKSEVSTSSWRGREGKRLSESSIATHSEKDFGIIEDVWKRAASGSQEKEIKEEPKEEPHPPRLLTKAAMKEFTSISSPLAAPTWNRDENGGNGKDTSDSSSSSDSEEERKEEDEGERRDDDEEKVEEDEERREEVVEEVEVKMEAEAEERKEETKEDEEIMEKKEEEVKEEENGVKIEEEESMQSIENDQEAETAVRGLQLASDDVIEETEKAVESIFDEDEPGEETHHYPSTDFVSQIHHNDLNLSSSSSQSSSPHLPSSSSLPHRPTPLHQSILSPSIHHHLQSHSLPPVSSPLLSPRIISPSASRPSSIHNFNVRPISQESSSHQPHEENGILIQQEKSWTPQGSSSDGPSPSPNQHPMAKGEVYKRFPVKWQGKVEVKKNDINTSWHKVHGEEGLLNTMFPAFESSIKVTGKFRLDNDSIQEVVGTMEKSDEDTACLVVTPAGSTQDQLTRNKELFTEHLVNFFKNKSIAGVIEFSTPDGLTYRCHMFAPGQVMTDYLSPRYPDFLELLNSNSTYANACLLALLKRKEE